MSLPDCMMPDGGDACAAYHELVQQLAEARQERDNLRKSIQQYLDCQTSNMWVDHFRKAMKD